MGINTQYVVTDFYRVVKCGNDNIEKILCRVKKFQSDFVIINNCKNCVKQNLEKKNIKSRKLTDGMGRTLRYVKVTK